MNTWFTAPSSHLYWIVLSCVVFYLLIIATTRLFGLRSFTTFSGFDFLITLAMGALLATTVVGRDVAVVEGFVALLSLFGLQLLVSVARVRWDWVKRLVDNPPTLLMENGQVLRRNLRSVRVTEDELRAKLRSQNVFSYEQVVAVVLERSGEVSVLKRSATENGFLDKEMLKGVVRGS